MNIYQNRKVAVTGGTGFIGGRLAERLVFEEGAIVNVLVNTWNKATWVSRADVNLIQGDVTNKKSLEPILENVDIVFHCAMSGSPALCRSVNVDGTRNVLEICEKFGVNRIVYFSTVGVHGPFIEEGMDEEALFLKLGNPYADSKIEAENLFWEYVSSSNIEGVVIRPTYVWGPNSKWFTVVPVQSIRDKNFNLVDEGKCACNAVYVDNVVDLALICGHHPKAAGEAFLIRDSDQISWGEFFKSLAEMVNVDPLNLNSVTSKSTVLKLSRNVQDFLDNSNQTLSKLISKFENRWPKSVRYGLKAPKKLIRIAGDLTRQIAPTYYNSWDIKKYSSPGHISIEKVVKLLNYMPRVSNKEGMKETEIWLKNQNYI